MLKRKDASANGVQFKNVAFKADKVNDDGTFTGYGSVFDVVDLGDDVVRKGAFSDYLRWAGVSKDNPLPALWQHRSGEPIGGYTMLKEDDRGLYVEGFLLKDSVARAAEAYALMKARVVRGLSIGYMIMEQPLIDKSGVRTLTKLDLAEISVVTFPMNTSAEVETVKSILDGATVRQVEEFLRDAGFSKSIAVSMAGVYGEKSRRESGGKMADVIDVLSNFKLLD